MREEITEHILKLLGESSGGDSIGNDEPLISSYVLDSMDVTDLFSFLEDKYSVSIAEIGGDFSQLDTINQIVEFVERKSN